MKYIDKSKVPTPNILKTKGKDATSINKEIFLKANQTEDLNFIFDNKIYAHDDVKQALFKIQGNFCCYCETPMNSSGYSNVEHYRPKAIYNNFKGDAYKIGYFWLAYSWENLLHSCSRCNTSHKQNYFPISDETKRAHNNGFSIEQEEPDILNPCVDNPDDHLTFHKEIITHKTERGRKTIELLGLDRDALDTDRRDRYGDVETMIEMCESVKGTPQEKKIREKLVRKLEEKVHNGAYTLMFKTLLNSL